MAPPITARTAITVKTLRRREKTEKPSEGSASVPEAAGEADVSSGEAQRRYGKETLDAMLADEVYGTAGVSCAVPFTSMVSVSPELSVGTGETVPEPGV